MTAIEFQTKAKEIGLSDSVISCQIKLQEKLQREGLPTIAYEDILRARQQRSCLTVFEEHKGA